MIHSSAPRRNPHLHGARASNAPHQEHGRYDSTWMPHCRRLKTCPKSDVGCEVVGLCSSGRRGPGRWAAAPPDSAFSAWRGRTVVRPLDRIVGPIPARSQPSIALTALHLETFFPAHITSPPPPLPQFPSPWPILEPPKQWPKGRSHRRRQIIEVPTYSSQRQRTSPLMLLGNRSQGIQPRKGTSRERTPDAERHRFPTRPSETPSPHVCLASPVSSGLEV